MDITKIEHTSSEDMFADYFTRTLHTIKHEKRVLNTGRFDLKNFNLSHYCTFSLFLNIQFYIVRVYWYEIISLFSLSF